MEEPTISEAPALLPKTLLVLGGARSGKSAWAESRIAAGVPHAWTDAVYVATAEAGDAEMAERIERHRRRRPTWWTAVEAPLRLPEALRDNAVSGRPMLVDCLTLWLSNLLHSGADPDRETERLIGALEDLPPPVVLVANEVGLGIVPDNPLARRFRDAAGRMNQRLAQAVDAVDLVVAGIAIPIKAAPTRR